MRPILILLSLGVAFAQKPTIGTVDSDLKRVAEEQAAAARMAKEAHAKSTLSQDAALRKLLAQQIRAELDASRRAKDVSESSDLSAYKQEQRLLAIERSIADQAKEKVVADTEAAISRKQLLDRFTQVTASLVVLLIAWGTKALYSLVVDGRNHRALVEKVEDNIKLSAEGVVAAKSAYTEANHVNLKIENLNRESIATNNKAIATEQQAGERLDKIDQVGVDTNTRVKGIESTVTSGKES